MIITPYSALDTESAIPVTADNFPALKHFFQCKEVAGATIMSDAVGGVVVPTAALTKPDANSICAAGGNISASDAALMSGAWAQPGTKKVVLLAVGEFGIASKVGMGLTSSARMALSGQVTSPDVSDGTTTKSATALTGGAGVSWGIGFAVDWTNITSFEARADGSAGYVAKTPVALTPLASISNIGAFVNFTNINNGAGGQGKLYGFAVFHFDSAIPGDIAAAVTWMTNRWVNGNKVIYPGWKGMS